MAVILLLATLQGISSGNQVAASQSVSESAQNLQKGIEYFYQNENRFPTAVEFADQATMAGYFTNFPPKDLPSKQCSQSYLYKRISDSSYQLSFCLPTSVNNSKKGWNTISQEE
jgi:hypothetical protein